MLQSLIQTMSNKDIKININKLLSKDNDQALSINERAAIAFAVGLSLKNREITNAIKQDMELIDQTHQTAANMCADTMAMNNIYYRSIHLIDDQNLTSTPAGLRMQSLMQHGIEKPLFELMSLAISAIHGCGMCLQAHFQQLQAYYNTEQIALALKIAAVLHALSLHLGHVDLMDDSVFF